METNGGRGMEAIQHRTLRVNGINMHVAEMGEGPAVLLLHGFPELWYSWRHQMAHLSARGFRAVAPDLRGFGGTDAPPSAAAYSTLHVVGDLVALLDALRLGSVFVVAHDFGAYHAWNLCLLRPDRVRALLSLSVPFRPRDASRKPLETMRAAFGDDFYICRFQEPGVAEEEFGRHDPVTFFKNFFSIRDPRPPCVPKSVGLGGPPGEPDASPPWLSEEDLRYYAAQFQRRGFTGGLNHYRSLDLNWELTAAWSGAQVRVPVKFVVGELDMTYSPPGVKEYVHGGGFKRDVPLLQGVTVMAGAAHYINQEKPEEINRCIDDFFRSFE